MRRKIIGYDSSFIWNKNIKPLPCLAEVFVGIKISLLSFVLSYGFVVLTPFKSGFRFQTKLLRSARHVGQISVHLYEGYCFFLPDLLI